MNRKPKVAVVMGSDSDLPVVKKCIDALVKFEIDVDVNIISAHRTPYEAESFAKSAASRDGAILTVDFIMLLLVNSSCCVPWNVRSGTVRTHTAYHENG